MSEFCNLTGRVAVITGPAKGMGAAATLMLAKAGADMVLVGRDLTPIEEVASDVRRLGRRAEIVQCDVTSDSDVDAMRDAALSALGTIDILVNIAGGTGPLGKRSWETTGEEFDQIINLNMKGCFLTMRSVLPTMIENAMARSSMWAAPSVCGAVRSGWPIARQNGACGASPRAPHWRWGHTTSMLIASAPAWWTVPVFRQYAPNAPTSSALQLKKPGWSMKRNTRCAVFQRIRMSQTPSCFLPAMRHAMSLDRILPSMAAGLSKEFGR